MLYFPLIKTHLPQWVPFIGGDVFEFFSPVFNIADASISIGVITLFLFQKRFVKKTPGNTELSSDNNTERLTANA
jgi:signal peptidase II